jgi:segregation and condensation protein B
MKKNTAKLHALLFAQQQGASMHDIVSYLESNEDVALQTISELETWLTGSGVAVFSHQDVYALVVDKPYAASMSAFSPEHKQQLSQPMLEVLAVIAHKQPCTKQDIDDIRGVASDQTLRNLISLGLIRQTTNTKDPLKLVRYETTPSFLVDMGIKDLRELAT